MRIIHKSNINGKKRITEKCSFVVLQFFVLHFYYKIDYISQNKHCIISTNIPGRRIVKKRKRKEEQCNRFTTESWWLIFKGNYTHLIESPPRLKLGEATWRGAVGPRTSLSVQLLFARWAPLVCYSALSRVSKRFPKYPTFTPTHATTNEKEKRGEKESKFDVSHQTLTLKTTLYVFLLFLSFPSLSYLSS